MQLSEAIALITTSHYAPTAPVKWADLGCGTGLFTHALASLLPAGSVIYAVDTNQASLARIAIHTHVTIKTIHQDFVQEAWPFDSLDGLLLANSLHYVNDKLAFLAKARHYVRESGSFLLVEYDTDMPNPWVPYPVSYVSLEVLCKRAGCKTIEKLGERPSIYGNASMYAAYMTC